MFLISCHRTGSSSQQQSSTPPRIWLHFLEHDLSEAYTVSQRVIIPLPFYWKQQHPSLISLVQSLTVFITYSSWFAHPYFSLSAGFLADSEKIHRRLQRSFLPLSLGPPILYNHICLAPAPVLMVILIFLNDTHLLLLINAVLWHCGIRLFHQHFLHFCWGYWWNTQ